MNPILLGYLSDPYEDALIFWTTCGPTDEFDPIITCLGGGPWFMQDGHSEIVASGANLAGGHYHFATAGPKWAAFRPAGGLAAVTGIDCNKDQVNRITNVRKLTEFSGSDSAFYVQLNSNLSIALAEIPRNAKYISLSGTLASGAFRDLPLGYTRLYTATCTLIAGSLSDIVASTEILWMYSCTGITPGSIAHLTAIRDLRIYSMGWTAQQNTDVLASAYNARMSYTYASGIQLRISAPTGTIGTEPPGDGESNTDWNWNAGTGKHEPLTGYAYIFMLGNDIYSEGYKTWSVTVV